MERGDSADVREGMEDYLTDIAATRLFLKKNFGGPEVVKALRFRLETHLKDPTLDPLSNQVWAAYQRLPELLEEPFSILDAGCMSGFLYHHLKKHKKDFTYVGMDRWPEAIEVAREYAPEVKFLVGDFLKDELGSLYDYVVCSNIPFKGHELSIAIAALVPCAKRKMILISPNSEIDLLEWTPRGTRHTRYA